MKNIKTFEEFITLTFDKGEINNDLISRISKEYPDKWILPNKDLGYIFIKDKPTLMEYNIPEKVYHVSEIPNIDKIGITPSTKSSTPFGYYNLSFFYIDIEDCEDGSIPYIEGKNYIYEVDTKATNIWYEPYNKDIDGEDDITTSEFIPPNFITKIK